MIEKTEMIVESTVTAVGLGDVLVVLLVPDGLIFVSSVVLGVEVFPLSSSTSEVPRMNTLRCVVEAVLDDLSNAHPVASH